MKSTVGCLGKIGYPTRAEANSAKHRLLTRDGYARSGDGRSVVGLDVYCCKKCGRFHLGRDKRKGLKKGDRTRTPAHRRDSLKNRWARYQALIAERGE